MKAKRMVLLLKQDIRKKPAAKQLPLSLHLILRVLVMCCGDDEAACKTAKESREIVSQRR